MEQLPPIAHEFNPAGVLPGYDQRAAAHNLPNLMVMLCWYVGISIDAQSTINNT
jgi:hypothetical protein